jgi:alpha/beta superfamily hydrolase
MASLSGPAEVVSERVRFRSGALTLEGELCYPEEGRPTGAAVLAGPHPFLGGSMDNNVLRALGAGLAQRGWASLRFNYRGVGGSQGQTFDLAARLAEFWQTSHSEDEREYEHDLLAAGAVLREAVGLDLPLALIGYSFGCSLLPVFQADTRALVLIAPTVGGHDLEAFTSLRQPKLVIAPEDDFAVDEGLLPGWFARLSEPRELVRPRLDGHFFRGCEDVLVETVGDFLDRQWR